jgi:hypothetical protein
MRRLALVFITSVLACGGSTEPGIDLSKPTGITPVSSANLTMIAGQATTVSVRVVNAAGSGVSNARVDFTATSGGTVGSPTVNTATDGSASTRWTTANVAGQQVLTATVSGTTFAIAIAATVTVPLTGAWVGTIGSQVLTLNLSEAGGVVSGSGTLTNTPSGTRALVAGGTLNGAALNVTLTSGSAQPFALTGTQLGTTISGSLTGSGFNANAITLAKQ